MLDISIIELATYYIDGVVVPSTTKKNEVWLLLAPHVKKSSDGVEFTTTPISVTKQQQ